MKMTMIGGRQKQSAHRRFVGRGRRGVLPTRVHGRLAVRLRVSPRVQRGSPQSSQSHIALVSHILDQKSDGSSPGGAIRRSTTTYGTPDGVPFVVLGGVRVTREYPAPGWSASYRCVSVTVHSSPAIDGDGDSQNEGALLTAAKPPYGATGSCDSEGTTTVVDRVRHVLRDEDGSHDTGTRGKLGAGRPLLQHGAQRQRRGVVHVLQRAVQTHIKQALPLLAHR